MTENIPPKSSGSKRRLWGKTLLIAGLFVSLLAFANLVSSSLMLFADLASGGMVQGHGQQEISKASSDVGLATFGLVLGLVSTVVGLILLALKSKD